MLVQWVWEGSITLVTPRHLESLPASPHCSSTCGSKADKRCEGQGRPSRQPEWEQWDLKGGLRTGANSQMCFVWLL